MPEGAGRAAVMTRLHTGHNHNTQSGEARHQKSGKAAFDDFMRSY